MNTSWAFLYVAVLAAVLLGAAGNDFKKIPFNGSMYGKRTVLVDYDAAAKALAAICEVATEACLPWNSQTDK